MPTNAREARVPVARAVSGWSVMAEVTQILCPICHKPNLRRARFCQHCGADIVLNNDRPTDGRRYVITRVVKEGGQGAVYEGIDESGQIFAIKEMLDKFTDPKERVEAIERFNEEAELLQRLSHKRIPKIYSHFTDEGRHYLTMDFIRGKDLEQIVEQQVKLSEAKAIEYADQICDVLDYLHGRGLVYRDMKPSNVMIETATDSVKLVDFGITKLFKPTERGTQIGTPGYAPPEQYQGLATQQSDIYALGATLHHMLTGRDPTEQMPFSFPRADSIDPRISKPVADALEKALQKVPQDRFGSIQEFWTALIPERATPQPVQVRVAPAATVQLPQAAVQAGAAPATGSVVTASPPPAPPSPLQPAQPAIPPQRPAVKPPKARPGRGFFGTIALILQWLVALLIVGAIGLGAYVWVLRPPWAEAIFGPVIELVPTAAPPTAAPLTSQQVTYTLEVTLPEGSDAATIRAAFDKAFADQAQADHGPNTRVAQNGTLGYVSGQPVATGTVNGQTTYSVTMRGFIYSAGP